MMGAVGQSKIKVNGGPPNLERAHQRMIQGVADAVFPGAVLLVAHGHAVWFERAYGVTDLSRRTPVTCDTFFDLASLTKPLATTLALLKLMTAGRLELDQPLASVIPAFKSTAKGAVTIRQLLNHTSGFPAYQPYFEALRLLAPARRQSALRALLVKEPLAGPIGRQVCYSDIGFMMLNWVIETVTRSRLDRFLIEMVYGPLGLDELFFCHRHSSSEPAGHKDRFAATEQCPWRNMTLCGQVHDDNAWVMGGVAGQAGLFGTARAVGRLLAMLGDILDGCGARHLFDRALLTRCCSDQSSSRGLGFDRPTPPGSSSGRYFSARTVGHLGFTGTSFWMDLDSGMIVVLLTNRVHPHRTNEKIKAFRPLIHDDIMSRVSLPAPCVEKDTGQGSIA